MTTQRDGTAGSSGADPAPDQAAKPEPLTGQVVPPPRAESAPDRPAAAATPEDPAADPHRAVLDDPEPAADLGPADDLGPAENGESAVDTETVTDREPEDAPPLMTDGEPADAPVLLSDDELMTDHEPADAPPLVTEEVPQAPPAAAPAPVADTPDTTPAAALAEQQWPGIQALFVDDPRGAVERAAAAASEVAASLIATLEREQTELRASWQQEADTEQLRTALQRYRAFCGRVEGLA